MFDMQHVHESSILGQASSSSNAGMQGSFEVSDIHESLHCGSSTPSTAVACNPSPHLAVCHQSKIKVAFEATA